MMRWGRVGCFDILHSVCALGWLVAWDLHCIAWHFCFCFGLCVCVALLYNDGHVR